MSHPAALPEDELLALCEVRRSRGSGPGGRHRNSTDSRVAVRHVESGLESVAGEHRSQHENLAVAVRRLRVALATHVRLARAPAAATSALWRSRCRGGRIACNPEHRDFPALLAEALDTLAAGEGDVHLAAERLDLTPTQLVRFVALHEPALVALNQQRAARGMPPLRR